MAIFCRIDDDKFITIVCRRSGDGYAGESKFCLDYYSRRIGVFYAGRIFGSGIGTCTSQKLDKRLT